MVSTGSRKDGKFGIQLSLEHSGNMRAKSLESNVSPVRRKFGDMNKNVLLFDSRKGGLKEAQNFFQKSNFSYKMTFEYIKGKEPGNIWIAFPMKCTRVSI